MHAQNGGLWGVDDGRAEQRAKHTSVGHSEGASIHLLNGQGAILSLAGEEGGGGEDDVRGIYMLSNRSRDVE